MKGIKHRTKLSYDYAVKRAEEVGKWNWSYTSALDAVEEMREMIRRGLPAYLIPRIRVIVTIVSSMNGVELNASGVFRAAMKGMIQQVISNPKYTDIWDVDALK